MLNRLGFAGRILAIMFLVLLAALAVGAGASFVLRTSQQTGPSLPLPEQAAAIVALLESSAPADEPLVLKAVSSDVLVVSLKEARPEFDVQYARVPALEWMLGQYLDANNSREILAAVDDGARSSQLRSLLNTFSPLSEHPLQIAISLKSGRYAMFEARGGIGSRTFGLPIGFWIGAIGAIVGLAAIRAVMREAEPLRLLADSVTRFANGAEPQPVVPQGAPEIRVLISSVNDMQSRIAKLIEGRTILLGAVSHDLRTFLTRLRLRVESIQDKEQHSKAVRDLDDMVHLIDGALAVARGNAAIDRRELVDLPNLVADEVADRPVGRCTFTAPAGRKTCNVFGDPVGLRRLVTNLIDNALRFGTRCAAEIRTENGTVFLTVDDNGPGIAEADGKMIFEPFYRADSSRSRATGGSGLGLAISKQIVESHGGKISFSKSPLGGARFCVTLKIDPVEPQSNKLNADR